MKIISWNCNGKFREKFKDILEEDADMYVICECENPSESKRQIKKTGVSELPFHTSVFYMSHVMN